MQLAVISDIHGNLEAFQAVLDDIDNLGIKNIISLGDNVGYGADPEAVVRLLQRRGVASVMGNHEMGLAEADAMDSFNPYARKALLQTRSLLRPETLAWIADLPRFIIRKDMRFVHGFPPDSISTYVFELTREEIARGMYVTPEPLQFVGHTHELEHFQLGSHSVQRARLVDGVLVRGTKHLINAGSVGQPRDGDLRAKYVLWDESLRRIEVRRIPYDNKGAAEKIVKAGLPKRYADRLLG
jgi:diadenosine tetraphosphatase ApaH/serine/threonine PP2A family protein phosphatase